MAGGTGFWGFTHPLACSAGQAWPPTPGLRAPDREAPGHPDSGGRWHSFAAAGALGPVPSMDPSLAPTPRPLPPSLWPGLVPSPQDCTAQVRSAPPKS